MSPAENKQSKTVGIIAGAGYLPLEIANGILSQGDQVYIIAIKGEAREDLAQFPGKILNFGQLGEVYETLREQEIKQILFAGGVRNRPDFSALKLDWQTVKTLPRILSLLATGDNNLLSGVISIFEEQGFVVVGVGDVAPQVLTPSGMLCGRKPSKKILDDITKGFKACKMLGALDAGQAAIVESGRVIALEAAEGTDAMIDRIPQLRVGGRLSPGKTGGVLVKTIKPKQEARADLPTIGPETITRVKAAGLSGIALEAGKSLIVDRDNTLALARQNGLFVMGVDGVEDA